MAVEIPTLECVVHLLEDPYAPDGIRADTIYEGMALCSTCLSNIAYEAVESPSFTAVREEVRRKRSRRERR